jgi:hypothetical protein
MMGTRSKWRLMANCHCTVRSITKIAELGLWLPKLPCQLPSVVYGLLASLKMIMLSGDVSVGDGPTSSINEKRLVISFPGEELALYPINEPPPRTLNARVVSTN